MPFEIFFFGSLVGLLPYTFILVRMGLTLDEIQTFGMDLRSMASLFGLGLLALVPTCIAKKAKEEDKQEKASTD